MSIPKNGSMIFRRAVAFYKVPWLVHSVRRKLATLIGHFKGNAICQQHAMNTVTRDEATASFNSETME